ncbi:ABC transporter permease [Candidatus Poriferisocius sp.]|uniref:ABC transporter permease n=1 Tax=Candidatus Poriferisocius sp. TaxID=3101276 RepID=UPI003B01E225
MLRVVGLKLIRLVPVLFLVSLATFFLIDLIPGDPAAAALGTDATIEDLEAVRKSLGLDKPITERYGDWLGGALTGDLGQSLRPPNEPVSDLLQRSAGPTLRLSAMALGMSFTISIFLGVWSAHAAGNRADRLVSGTMFTFISVPTFLAGLLFIFFFVFRQSVPRYLWLIIVGLVVLRLAYLALSRLWEDRSDFSGWAGYMVTALVVAGLLLWVFFQWPDFPRTASHRYDDNWREQLRSLFLPALALALSEIAVFTRLLRADMLSTLQEQFVLSSRAKGMPTWRILFRDALRPSSFSLITIAGITLGRLIGGTVIIESIFGLEGLGKLIVAFGVLPKNYTVVQGGVLVLAVGYVLLNAIIDISYQYLDPRIRRGRV